MMILNLLALCLVVVRDLMHAVMQKNVLTLIKTIQKTAGIRRI